MRKKDAKRIRPATALCRGEFQCTEILGWLGQCVCVCVCVQWMNETSRSVRDRRFTWVCSLSVTLMGCCQSCQGKWNSMLCLERSVSRGQCSSTSDSCTRRPAVEPTWPTQTLDDRGKIIKAKIEYVSTTSSHIHTQIDRYTNTQRSTAL